MKGSAMKGGIVVVLVFLSVGVTIAPSINFCVVKASNDNEIVEVTTQACGIKGFGNQTVKLTRQQYQNLEQYLVDFRARLNQTTTREDAVPIFNEAVVELNKYGLLPKGMSVEQAQRLVTGRYQKIEQFLKPISNIDSNSEIINCLCLVAAHMSWGYEKSILLRFVLGLILIWKSITFIPKTICQFLALIWDKLGFGLEIIPVILLSIVYQIMYIEYVLSEIWGFCTLQPLRFMNTVKRDEGGTVVSFFSAGLYGIQRNTSDIDFLYGFTGLKLKINYYSQNNYDPYYLGSALLIT
jgi:hypothetical protein